MCLVFTGTFCGQQTHVLLFKTASNVGKYLLIKICHVDTKSSCLFIYIIKQSACQLEI